MRTAPLLVASAVALTFARASAAEPPPASPVPPASAKDHEAAGTKPPVVIWPTMTPSGDGPDPAPLHRPQAVADKGVFEAAQELDATLRDAVQDLGFALYVAEAGPGAGRTRDQDLVERAAHSAAGGAAEEGTWVVSPRIETAGGGEYLIRIVVVPPNGRELRVRVASAPADSIGVRGLVMLRDLLSTSTAARAAVERQREEAATGTTQGIMGPLRSQGRAVLAVNAGLFGAYSAFSVQRASGSDDPRVLYPLLALGTGIGIGAALLVADEWDVTGGDAWLLSAGAWWGAAAGVLIVAGSGLQPFDNRYSWGVGGGLIGAGLATFALTRSRMDDGDAMLAHSGGALGLLLGGEVELLYKGATTASVTPYAGAGYGTAIGLLAAGTLATQVTVSPSRVLLVDLGAGGGGLIGAAIASPLIFQTLTPDRTRGWISATLGGSVVGGLAAWWLTRDAPAKHAASWRYGTPGAGVLGATETPRGPVPFYGITWSGAM